MHSYGIIYAYIIDDELFPLKHSAMRTRLLIGMIALLICSCSSVKKTSKTPVTLMQKSQDSTEYEILITDSWFDQWYNLNYTPVKDYSEEYYRSKNLIGVTNWNDYTHAE